MVVYELANIYVQKEDKSIYKIFLHEPIDSRTICYRYIFELVAGYNEQLGYVNPEMLINRFDSILVYPLEECLTGSLNDNGYTILTELPETVTALFDITTRGYYERSDK